MPDGAKLARCGLSRRFAGPRRLTITVVIGLIRLRCNGFHLTHLPESQISCAVVIRCRYAPPVAVDIKASVVPRWPANGRVASSAMKDAVHDAARARLATDQHPTRAERMAVRAGRRRPRFDPSPSSPPQPACHHSIIRSRKRTLRPRFVTVTNQRCASGTPQCSVRIWHDRVTDRAVPHPPNTKSPSAGRVH